MAESNLPKITAESIMTAEVFAVTPDMTVRSAIEMLTEKKIAGAPVVDFQKIVLSVASEGDLLKLAATFGLEKSIADCLPRLPKQDKLITIRRTDAFEKIYRIFLSRPIHRLIVCDDRGKLQGIVSRSNLLKVLVKSIEKPLEKPKGDAAATDARAPGPPPSALAPVATASGAAVTPPVPPVAEKKAS